MTPVSGAGPSIESMDDFFDRTGPLPTNFDDVRRFARFYFRSCAEAVIHPLVKRSGFEPAQRFVLTCDLSRTGLRLLHNEQLFPGQRVDVMLNGQPARAMEVVWCKRIAPKRYAVGCRFTAGDEEQTS
jgi:hypothetical protein